MGLRINTNIQSLIANRQLTQTSKKVNASFEKLSTGVRINHSSDDAAGLAISDALHADIRSLNQGIRNAQDGVSLVQIYEGGTSEINNMLIRMRELAMHSATDTIGDRERQMIDNEFQQLTQEIERVSQTTEFNGHKLLNGEDVDMHFQVGNNNEEEIDRIHFAPGQTDLTSGGLGIDGLEVADRDSARDVLDTIDEALFTVNDTRARVGSAQSRLETAIASQQIFVENLSGARSRILDTDYASEVSELTSKSIIQQAGVSVLAQANNAPRLAVKLLG